MYIISLPAISSHMPPDRAQSGPHKRAPRVIKPYTKKPGPKAGSSKAKLTPKTSALPEAPSHQRTNLTLYDWLRVVAWYDHNQPISQDETVKHFQNLQVDALIFTQSTLSRHLTENGRQHDQAKLASTPTALSSKRMRIVTRPDVEECLRLWVYHMEEKRETVTGPMLIEKRARFEDQLCVPENERLRSDGWIQKFLRA